ncbi:phosphoserine phosphatase [Cavenderia fasciculata]|uniref:phosphoserine phosphatase n=1 Tax=Cavenderia fasciculata TaxID=261658 RepID=F4QF87_CACFS|nr:phosphoserine phosphatase [Cavenderia fasciculata]EGG14241.1 phosphoserine phosphatase [Cavenderia fasciculata]|eukprot:XP_004350950.1 phosphoserine phosphatase [Cavenderia fasciculata]
MSGYTLVLVSDRSNQIDHQLHFDHLLNKFNLKKTSAVDDLSNNSYNINVYKFNYQGTSHDDGQLSKQFHDYLDNKSIDFYFNNDNHYGNQRKLAAFDMDSCIIKNECIDEMAVIMGVSDKVSEITKKAMEGHYNFDEALRERLNLLKGMTCEQLEMVWEKIELNAGAYTLIKTLKYLGFKVALVSGGFTYYSYRIGSRLGFDYVFSNQLEIIDNKLTGKVIGSIVNGQMKKALLEKLTELNGLEQKHTVSMGDGSNDKLMVQYSDLGIAYHAKSILKAATPYHITFTPLSTLCIYLPNYKDIKDSDILDGFQNKELITKSVHSIPQYQTLIDQYKNDLSIKNNLIIIE